MNKEHLVRNPALATQDPRFVAGQIGKQSSQITQNGQWVSGKNTGLDGWQDQRADRAAQVQAAIGH